MEKKGLRGWVVRPTKVTKTITQLPGAPQCSVLLWNGPSETGGCYVHSTVISEPNGAYRPLEWIATDGESLDGRAYNHTLRKTSELTVDQKQ